MCSILAAYKSKTSDWNDKFSDEFNMSFLNFSENLVPPGSLVIINLIFFLVNNFFSKLI